MHSVSVFSPAKVNLYLAITDRREDGFHNLVSVAAPVTLGDTLSATLAGGSSLTCDDPAVPVDGTNLVLRAAAMFKQVSGWEGGAAFHLEKRIPMGAGLGGGSSNAVAALRALNELTGAPLSLDQLRQIAAGLGADCALFLENAPVIMRGRGELLETMTAAEQARLRGQRLVLFKPGFGVSTPWAYGRMAAVPGSYLASDEAEAHLEAWRNQTEVGLEGLLFNNMEPVVFEKYPALPTLHRRLREKFGLAVRMSGSGSASLAVLDDMVSGEAVTACIREAWGESSWVETAAIS